MKFKTGINIVDFLQTVRDCRGEVSFQTDEGDVLNLKSQLSKYVFLAVADERREGFLTKGHVVCELEHDKAMLQSFLTE